MAMPKVDLKIIVVVHWLLTVWACMEHWMPRSYAWSNFTVLGVGAWAAGQRNSADAIVMFLAGLLLTIVTDILHISLYYPRSEPQSDLMRFVITTAILSLVLKPFSSFFAYQMFKERGGSCNIGLLSDGPDRSSYQPIDHPESPEPYPDVANKPIPPRRY